jgi:hypothetical protein
MRGRAPPAVPIRRPLNGDDHADHNRRSVLTAMYASGVRVAGELAMECSPDRPRTRPAPASSAPGAWAAHNRASRSLAEVGYDQERKERQRLRMEETAPAKVEGRRQRNGRMAASRGDGIPTPSDSHPREATTPRLPLSVVPAIRNTIHATSAGTKLTGTAIRAGSSGSTKLRRSQSPANRRRRRTRT